MADQPPKAGEADPNPYEPPQTKSPDSTEHLIKRGIGVGFILLLTPPAVGIAIWTSCSIRHVIGPDTAFWLAFVAPIVVLSALMACAAKLARRQQGDPSGIRERVRLLWATPPVFGLAIVAGFVFTAALVLLQTNLHAYEQMMRLSPWLFWTIPAIALIVMLIRAWRAGRD